MKKRENLFSNGRLFILSDKEIGELHDFVKSACPPPKVGNVKLFIEENFEEMIFLCRTMNWEIMKSDLADQMDAD